MSQPRSAEPASAIPAPPPYYGVRGLLDSALANFVVMWSARAATLTYHPPIGEPISIRYSTLNAEAQEQVQRAVQSFSRHTTGIAEPYTTQRLALDEVLVTMPIRAGTSTVGLLHLIIGGDSSSIQAETALLLMQATGGEADKLAMLQQTQQDLEELQLLYDVGQALAGNLDLTSLLEDMKRRVPDVMRAERCSIMLLDDAGEQLVLETLDPTTNEPHVFYIPLNRGIAGWVATNGIGQIVNDVQRDPRWYDGVARDIEFDTHSIVCAPMQIGERVVGVMQVLNKRSGEPFTEHDLRLLTTLAAQAAIAVENARLVRSLKAERDKLLAKEAEVRAAIARDLHDGPTQSVAAMAMNIDFIKKLLHARPEMVEDELTSLGDLARKTSHDIRTLLFELRPLGLETQGLLATLHQYASTWRDPGGRTRLRVAAEGQIPRLPVEIEGAIFMIIQEAVNNARKYAGLGTITISLSADDQMFYASIQDEGNGFDVQAVDAGYATRGSLGLLNMRERARLIGANCSITSRERQGTQVLVQMPLGSLTRHQ